MTMEKVQCDLCGKEIIGWHKKHAEYLLSQHKLVHILKDKKVAYKEVIEEHENLSWKERRKIHKLNLNRR